MGKRKTRQKKVRLLAVRGLLRRCAMCGNELSDAHHYFCKKCWNKRQQAGFSEKLNAKYSYFHDGNPVFKSFVAEGGDDGGGWAE